MLVDKVTAQAGPASSVGRVSEPLIIKLENVIHAQNLEFYFAADA